MLYPKTNVCKLRNGVLLSLSQNHTEVCIVFDLLFNVPRNICGGSVLVFVLLCTFMFFLFLLAPRRGRD